MKFNIGEKVKIISCKEYTDLIGKIATVASQSDSDGKIKVSFDDKWCGYFKEYELEKISLNKEIMTMRCKDCKFYTTDEEGNEECKKFHNYTITWNYDNNFCQDFTTKKGKPNCCKIMENIDAMANAIIFRYYDFDEENPVYRFCMGKGEVSENYKTYEEAFIGAKKYLMKIN